MLTRLDGVSTTLSGLGALIPRINISIAGIRFMLNYQSRKDNNHLMSWFHLSVFGVPLLAFERYIENRVTQPRFSILGIVVERGSGGSWSYSINYHVLALSLALFICQQNLAHVISWLPSASGYLLTGLSPLLANLYVPLLAYNLVVAMYHSFVLVGDAVFSKATTDDSSVQINPKLVLFLIGLALVMPNIYPMAVLIATTVFATFFDVFKSQGEVLGFGWDLLCFHFSLLGYGPTVSIANNIHTKFHLLHIDTPVFLVGETNASSMHAKPVKA